MFGSELMIKCLSVLLVFVITCLSAVYPYLKRYRLSQAVTSPLGEALAAGVFLGAGLMHMLADAAQNFSQLHIEYPVAYLLAGAMFLILLLIEHVGKEIFAHQKDGSQTILALLAALMLSLHSFLAGSALGLSSSLSLFFLVLIAILAHKSAASFALAVKLNRSGLRFSTSLIVFAFFSLMVPFGAAFGFLIAREALEYPMLEPIFNALAAGTFIYLGTLHGLRNFVEDECCDLRQFFLVIFGFALMAVVAIWT